MWQKQNITSKGIKQLWKSWCIHLLKVAIDSVQHICINNVKPIHKCKQNTNISKRHSICNVLSDLQLYSLIILCLFFYLTSPEKENDEQLGDEALWCIKLNYLAFHKMSVSCFPKNSWKIYHSSQFNVTFYMYIRVCKANMGRRNHNYWLLIHVIVWKSSRSRFRL